MQQAMLLMLAAMQQMQLQRLLTQLGRAPRTLLQLQLIRLQMLHVGQLARQMLPGRAPRKLLLMQLQTLPNQLGSAPRMQLPLLLSV
jgi:hypothetical protein